MGKKVYICFFPMIRAITRRTFHKITLLGVKSGHLGVLFLGRHFIYQNFFPLYSPNQTITVPSFNNDSHCRGFQKQTSWPSLCRLGQHVGNYRVCMENHSEQIAFLPPSWFFLGTFKALKAGSGFQFCISCIVLWVQDLKIVALSVQKRPVFEICICRGTDCFFRPQVFLYFSLFFAFWGETRNMYSITNSWSWSRSSTCPKLSLLKKGIVFLHSLSC